jgi:signal transduction histidine kinase
MFERRSLRWPISLAVTMIVLLVALAVGWILLAVFGALEHEAMAPFYWTVLSIGTVFLVIVVVGVVLYLILAVKTISLNQRQSNFIDAVTHELKSPLASLKLYLQTLNRRTVSAEQQADFHRYMLDDVERLDQLINQLLDAARIDRRPTARDIEDVELSGLLRDCADAVCLRYRVPETTVRWQVEPCIVRAAQVDLDMIFRNLIDNAVKYASDDDPQVTVTLRAMADGQRLQVRVEDNGRGIPPKARRLVFRRFFRVGSELERDKPGTGLGLYIVGVLVRRLKGRVRVLDRADQSGTAFEVVVPGRRA